MIWGVNVPWDYDLVDYQRMHMMCCESDDDVLLMLLVMQHHQYYKMTTERCIAVAAAVTGMRSGMMEALAHEMMMASVVSGRCCYKWNESHHLDNDDEDFGEEFYAMHCSLYIVSSPPINSQRAAFLSILPALHALIDVGRVKNSYDL
jgi:hypothetical protein